MSYKIASKT